MTTDLLTSIADRSARVAVLGQGYVGLVVSMRASEAGFGVVGLEVDVDRAKRLAAGESYIEDVDGDTLRAALDRGYRPTADPADLAEFDVAVISVPTPLRDGTPDLTFIEDAARMLAPHLRPGALVVLESTTYPGTTAELLGPTLAEHAPGDLEPGRDFLLGYSPERIDPGNTSFSLHNTPKIVAGIDAASLAATEAFFSAFVETVVPVSGTGEAELAKLIENTFRHVNIALVNEIAMFAGDLGIDAFEAIEAAATKPFGFMKFLPGPGVGGHCLPIDPTYLSWRVKRHLGESFRFIELANDVNAHMPHYVARRIQHALNGQRKSVNGATVVVLGVAYKRGVGDIREAPALSLMDELRSLGAEVVPVDPHVPEGAVPGLRDSAPADLLRGCDIVVIVTDHDEFDYEEVVGHAPLVLDTRHRLRGTDSPNVERL